MAVCIAGCGDNLQNPSAKGPIKIFADWFKRGNPGVKDGIWLPRCMHPLWPCPSCYFTKSLSTRADLLCWWCRCRQTESFRSVIPCSYGALDSVSKKSDIFTTANIAPKTLASKTWIPATSEKVLFDVYWLVYHREARCAASTMWWSVCAGLQLMETLWSNGGIICSHSAIVIKLYICVHKLSRWYASLQDDFENGKRVDDGFYKALWTSSSFHSFAHTHFDHHCGDILVLLLTHDLEDVDVIGVYDVIQLVCYVRMSCLLGLRHSNEFVWLYYGNREHTFFDYDLKME